MLKVRVDIKGDKKIVAQLRKMLKVFKDWRPELEAVGDYLKDFYRDPVFETEGGIFSARWTALSQPYQSKKATLWPGRGILEASGTMRKSYEVKVYASMLSLINPVEYAIYHQEGRGLPERVLIKVDEERKKQIVDIFKKGALKKIRDAL